MRLGHDLPISVSDRVISPFREDFIFTKHMKINPQENFRIYSSIAHPFLFSRQFRCVISINIEDFAAVWKPVQILKWLLKKPSDQDVCCVRKRYTCVQKDND